MNYWATIEADRCYRRDPHAPPSWIGCRQSRTVRGALSVALKKARQLRDDGRTGVRVLVRDFTDAIVREVAL